MRTVSLFAVRDCPLFLFALRRSIPVRMGKARARPLVASSHVVVPASTITLSEKISKIISRGGFKNVFTNSI